jgi:hypothetical protein
MKLGAMFDACIFQEVVDELPRIKPTPPPLPTNRRGSGILVFFDEKPVNVQYEDVRRGLRVAHCFKELDDVSHAFDHLVIMLLMLPLSSARDNVVETIVNLKMEFFGNEDEANGLPRATSKSGARRERETLQRNVQRRPDGTVVYRHGQTE